MWRGIADGFQQHVPGGTWVGTVHVQARGDNGLNRDELQAAYDSGMRRISCGLETGSQRVNDSMAKGTQIERTSEFIRDAHAVGLSVRATMMLGYPGKRAEDVASTSRFLREHEPLLDRIHMSPFQALPRYPIRPPSRRGPEQTWGPDRPAMEPRRGSATFRHTPSSPRAYRRQRTQVLNILHRINAKPLRNQALEFDGV